MPTLVADICITALTVAAFVLSAAGLLHVRSSAAAGMARMENDRSVRDTLRAQYLTEHAAASAQPEREAALQRWYDRHDAAGVEPHTRQTLEDGREVLAERSVRELNTGSRADLVLVGLGLLCGLAASVWSIWLP